MYAAAVSERFAHLLSPRVFTGDRPMGWAVVACGDEPQWSSGSARQAWMAQGIFRRLVSLGRAYSLHTLGNLDPLHPNRFGSAPARSLREEFEFLASFVDDPVAKKAMAEVLPLLGECERDETGELEIVIRAE